MPMPGTTFNALNGSESAPYEYFFNTRLSKGVCAYNIPILFNWSTVYQLPLGRKLCFPWLQLRKRPCSICRQWFRPNERIGPR